MRDYLNVCGIMTGNSLDGADLVLTKFSLSGDIHDLAAYSVSYTSEIADSIRLVRKIISENNGDMLAVVTKLSKLGSEFGDFDAIEDRYTRFIASAVEDLIKTARLAGVMRNEIDLIGSHGQTCAHFPPSIAKNTSQDRNEVYTIQIGNPQKLANLTGITVVSDFRSDDIMNGGEGAPLAPIHHRHLANYAIKQGNFPIAFCNAGNTGNISVITKDLKSNTIISLGYDTGPFNDFPDKLMKKEMGKDFDRNGIIGREGKVNLELLKLLFDKAVLTKDGANFLHQPPPKSSDPEWYKIISELSGESLVAGSIIPFPDRLRTAQYFSAYIFFYSLIYINKNLDFPRHFALSGGGWKNPVIKQHFIDLISGNFSASPILLEHELLLKDLLSRITNNGGVIAEVKDSIDYGFDGTTMEARIFADAAYCRITGTPFSLPETTGVNKPTIAGIIRYKDSDPLTATATLREWLKKFESSNLTVDDPKTFDARWSRAALGWQKRL